MNLKNIAILAALLFTACGDAPDDGTAGTKPTRLRADEP